MVNSKPIWKDESIVLNDMAQPSLAYDIFVGADRRKVYSGVAYRKAQGKAIAIKVNDIIAGQLKQELPNTTDNPSVIASLQESCSIVDEKGVEYNASFRLDWSYKNGYDPNWAGGLLSAPINGKVSPKQRLAFTKIGDAPSVKITFVDRGGVRTDKVVTASSDFNYLLTIPEGTEYIFLNDEISFTISKGCEGFCLYYVNEFGGWDSLLIGGHGIKTDGYKRYTHQREYDNAQATAAGKVSYLNEITKRYELHTDWLLGDAGERMHHLLGSNKVMLQDLSTGEVTPVIITDNECRYRNYHNNGNQLVAYTINVEVARDYKRQ